METAPLTVRSIVICTCFPMNSPRVPTPIDVLVTPLSLFSYVTEVGQSWIERYPGLLVQFTAVWFMVYALDSQTPCQVGVTSKNY